MPPNSISLEFNKMPTVTVDGKTHKFKADKAGGYDQINKGGVTYSLVKDKDSGRFTMTMSGEPAALEKYNFSVGKGRVTNANFGKGDSMENFFKGSVAIGKKDNDYFANFSFAGGHLANRTAFLQSGAWAQTPTPPTRSWNASKKRPKKPKKPRMQRKPAGRRVRVNKSPL